MKPKLNVLSFALFQSQLAALVGLLAGILYSFGGLFYDLTTIGLNAGTALAFFALLGMPVLFGLVGFVFGVLGGLLYNIITRWVGRKDLDFSQ